MSMKPSGGSKPSLFVCDYSNHALFFHRNKEVGNQNAGFDSPSEHGRQFGRQICHEVDFLVYNFNFQQTFRSETGSEVVVSANDLEKIVELGRGAYGVVEEMRHRPTGLIFAVKVPYIITP